jgi:long-chain acyl-CoA synthetase
MQVEHFLELSARKYPNKVALVFEEQRLTYGQIDRDCNRLANALLASGVRRGDRVVICLPNGVDAVVAVFAALKAGAVFVLANHTTKSEKLIYILNNCRACALIIWDSKLRELNCAGEELPCTNVIFGVGSKDLLSAASSRLGKPLVLFTEAISETRADAAPANKCIDMDLAALIYTSGSTGRPKGVMLTHLNIVSAASSITTYLDNTPDDVVINVLPLSFDYGLYQVLMMFKVGGRVVLEQSFNYPFQLVKRLIDEQVTGLPIVPTISARLLQLDLSKYQFPSLRYITNTAAALPTQHIKDLRRLFPNVKIYSMYGLTECKRVSYLPPDQIDIRPASVGRGMPNEEVYIVDDQDRRVGPGVIGELVIRGSNVMKGYWELPEETQKALKPGPLPGEMVLYSGDLFRADEDGYLYFVGRKDDIIKSRGEKVSPREIEDVIYGVDGVVEVAVVGVPDPVLGNAIKAMVSLRPGARVTQNDILRRCREKLEDFMIPNLIEFHASLPKTESGKISKRMIPVIQPGI